MWRRMIEMIGVDKIGGMIILGIGGNRTGGRVMIAGLERIGGRIILIIGGKKAGGRVVTTR